MKRRRKLQAAAVLSAILAGVPVWIQVDRWLIERRQIQAQMHFELAVAECEAGGGEWWKGDCRRPDR